MNVFPLICSRFIIRIIIFDSKKYNLIFIFLINFFQQIIIKPFCQRPIISDNRLPLFQDRLKLFITLKIRIAPIMKVSIIHAITWKSKPNISSLFNDIFLQRLGSYNNKNIFICHSQIILFFYVHGKFVCSRKMRIQVVNILINDFISLLHILFNLCRRQSPVCWIELNIFRSFAFFKFLKKQLWKCCIRIVDQI